MQARVLTEAVANNPSNVKNGGKGAMSGEAARRSGTPNCEVTPENLRHTSLRIKYNQKHKADYL